MSKKAISIAELMLQSGVKFGTSGARGLADAMTDQVCYAYTKAFLQHLLQRETIRLGDAVAIAGDFRPSSPRIMAACGKAIIDAGFTVVHCGFIPTPAVAAYGLDHRVANLMVTGSHIPDDRNGIKFNTPYGEILKEDEQGIAAQSVEIADQLFSHEGALLKEFTLPNIDNSARDGYVDRYLRFFPEGALSGKHIAVYQHSTVARDLMADICKGLGAEVSTFGRSDIFIPVDTEAIRDEDVALAKQWAVDNKVDAIISADGDGDRPLISDERGTWLRGDVAGILCASYLAIDALATPVSSNSAVEKSQRFEVVKRTQIGSPFVISAMQQLQSQYQTVAGYEANGGFLLATDATIDGRTISALPTRDALVVQLTILMLSNSQHCTISDLVSQLPARFTHSDRVKDFPTQLSQSRLGEMSSGDFEADKTAIHQALGDEFGELESINYTDGLRMTFKNQDVLHLRPSGNAPELRCYSESTSYQQAKSINQQCMNILKSWRFED